jgi:DNA-directed RNA polymerase specialized sigma24 family protein
MEAPAFGEQRWRAAQPLVTVEQAAACLFALLLARPRYYLSIARRWLPWGSDAEDLVMEVVLGLCERAPRRADGPDPIRNHGGYLARAVHRAAVHRSRRLRTTATLKGPAVVAVDDVERLAEVDLELEWGWHQLRELLGSGQLPLTLNQYRALSCQGSLNARQRAARARGRRLLMPLLRDLAVRLRDGGERDSPVLDEDGVLFLLDAIGFFEADVRELVAYGRSQGSRRAAVAGHLPIDMSLAEQVTNAAGDRWSRRREP